GWPARSVSRRKATTRRSGLPKAGDGGRCSVEGFAFPTSAGEKLFFSANSGGMHGSTNHEKNEHGDPRLQGQPESDMTTMRFTAVKADTDDTDPNRLALTYTSAGC